MSLSPGDMVEIPDGDRKGLWVVRKLYGNGQIFFKKATDATPAGEGLWGPSPGPLIGDEGAKGQRRPDRPRAGGGRLT